MLAANKAQVADNGDSITNFMPESGSAKIDSYSGKASDEQIDRRTLTDKGDGGNNILMDSYDNRVLEGAAREDRSVDEKGRIE